MRHLLFVILFCTSVFIERRLAFTAGDCDCGWGCITTETGETGSPASNSQTYSGTKGHWSWDISGSEGDFVGHAEAVSLGTTVTKSTGLHNATGFKKKRVGTWVAGCHNCSAPTDARVTGCGVGTASCTAFMNANNGWFDRGKCVAYARAKIVFSGVATAEVDVLINATYEEADSSISGSGTISTKEGDSSFVASITPNFGSDTCSMNGADIVSVTTHFDGNIAGMVEKGTSFCAVSASSINNALKCEVDVATTIDELDLSGDSGGTSSCLKSTFTVAEPGDCP